MEIVEIELKDEETQLTFKELLEGAGYTVITFAKVMGVDTDTVYKWIYRKSNVSLPRFLDICRILRQDPYELLASLGYDMTGIPHTTNRKTVTKTIHTVAKAPGATDLKKKAMAS